jgi:bacterioferritin
MGYAHRMPNEPKTNGQPFLSDVKELRRRARESIEKGAVTSSYGLPTEDTIAILQSALATEIVCVLRYTMHAVSAAGLNSKAAQQEFEEHAKDELDHMNTIADRINQLGGVPNMNPEGLLTRSHTEYGPADLDLVGMLKENLIAERIAVESYTEIIRFLGNKDVTTRTMLEKILQVEEDHANDMHDLLVAHEGRPMLKR